MQLVFSAEEFRLLIDVLLDSERVALRSGQHDSPVSALLQRVLAHDLSFGVDELENLEEILRSQAAKLRQGESADEQGTRELQQRMQLLDHVLDRVTEACAMA